MLSTTGHVMKYRISSSTFARQNTFVNNHSTKCVNIDVGRYHTQGHETSRIRSPHDTGAMLKVYWRIT